MQVDVPTVVVCDVSVCNDDCVIGTVFVVVVLVAWLESVWNNVDAPVLNAAVINETFDNITVLVGIEELPIESIVLFITFVVDCWLFVEVFMVDKNVEPLWTALVGVVLLTVGVEDPVNTKVALVLPKVFVDDNDDVDGALDVDDDA